VLGTGYGDEFATSSSMAHASTASCISVGFPVWSMAIGEKLTEGDEIEVEVLEIDIEKQRVSRRIPMDDTDSDS
jgi:hypothetical protein